MRAPLVSIITPVYNAARWLPETLSTVSAQTFTDWEHILVDDGSSDNSRAICEAASRADSRFRLISKAHRAGPSAARNAGIDAARGRFLAFLDADDLWHPEKLSRALEWIAKYHYPFVYHDYRHMSADGTHVGELIVAPETLDLHTLHTRRGHGGCMSIVIDREQAPGFRFPLHNKYLHEDLCAWLSLVQGGHVGHRLPGDLGRYRISSHSRSANRIMGAVHTWKIYREKSKLPLLRASFWWVQYVWNSFWMHRRAAPRYQVRTIETASAFIPMMPRA